MYGTNPSVLTRVSLYHKHAERTVRTRGTNIYVAWVFQKATFLKNQESMMLKNCFAGVCTIVAILKGMIEGQEFTPCIWCLKRSTYFRKKLKNVCQICSWMILKHFCFGRYNTIMRWEFLLSALDAGLNWLKSMKSFSSSFRFGRIEVFTKADLRKEQSCSRKAHLGFKLALNTTAI